MLNDKKTYNPLSDYNKALIKLKNNFSLKKKKNYANNNINNQCRSYVLNHSIKL